MKQLSRVLGRHYRSARRGQAAVETALVLTIILILALATFDLGRGIAAHVALNEAVQEGALYAGYRYHDPGVAVDQVVVQARVQTSSPFVDAVDEAIVTVTGGECDQYVIVQGTYDMPVISPASAIFGPTIALAVAVEATNMNSIEGVGTCP